MTRFGPAVLAVSLTLAACSTSTPPAATVQGPTGSLTYSVLTPPTNLDPALQAAGLQGMLWTNPLYDTLTYQEANFNLKPLLATSWKTGSDAAGPYVDFALRQGLKFPDGTAFNAATVVATIKRDQTLAGSLTAPDVASVTAIDTISPFSVRLHSANAVALPALLSGPAGMMISQTAIANGTDLTKTPAGIGMFQLSSFAPPQVIYTATPGYWDTSAQRIKQLTIVGNGDDNSRLNLLRTGKVDLTYLNPALDASAKGSASGYSNISGPLAVTYGFAINTSVKPFDNPQVRKAMAQAIDRETVCKTVLFSECLPNYQLYPTISVGYDQSITSSAIPYDPAAAKSVIQAAGATGTQFTMLNIAGVAKFQTLGTAVQGEWNAIGFNVTVRSVPNAQELTQFGVSHAAPVAFFAFGAFAEPSQPVVTYLSPTSRYNPGQFDNPQIDTLGAQALSQSDPAKRKVLYQQISALTTQDLLIIPVVTPEILYWVSSKIHGFVPPITNAAPLWRGVSITP